MRIFQALGVLLICLFGFPGTARSQQTAPPTGPIPLGINGDLAPWLQVRGELRTRVEGFQGSGFTSGNDDAYWMDRFRFNVTIRPKKALGFFVQTQDARAFDKTSGASLSPLRNTLDLRQAYGELGTATSIRVGRQELVFGEQRLIGHANWLNAARSFDGARLTLKRKSGQFDLFAASVVAIQPEKFDKSGGGAALYGAYGSLVTLMPGQTLEPYVLWRQTKNITAELGGTAVLHQATAGVRLAGKLPSAVDYSTELAFQAGSAGPDDIRAWAGHGLVGKTFAAAPTRPRAFVEFNYASGDKSGTDGTRATFDQLFPTAHDKFGLADQVGWRNIEHLRAGVEVKPGSKWLVSASYHTWWLASATDGLFNAGGALVARSVTGVAGRHVGQEADIQATYTYSPQLQIGGGYANLTPGEFLKNVGPGQSYRYPYVMVTYVFLGEKPAIGGRQTR